VNAADFNGTLLSAFSCPASRNKLFPSLLGRHLRFSPIAARWSKIAEFRSILTDQNGEYMKALAYVLPIIAVLALTACGQNKVSYRDQVKPILAANCLECHTPPLGAGYTASGLDLSTYDGLMKGTKFGPVIVPGNTLSSTLLILIEGKAHPTLRMPHGKAPLKPKEIETIKRWVEQGATNN
jgi:Planctomycete cytochrome C